jgi:hypothetical protein
MRLCVFHNAQDSARRAHIERENPSHPNASLIPRGRRKMVRVVIEYGWTIEAAAERFQVDAKTVTK